MSENKKRSETDERHNPVTARNDDDFMVEVELLLALDHTEKGPIDPNQFAGTIELTEDPLEYQRRSRGD